jgi:hypothetical protein
VSGSYDAPALLWDCTGREPARKQRDRLTGAAPEACWSALADRGWAEADPAVLALADAEAVGALPAGVPRRRYPAGREGGREAAGDLDDDDLTVRETASRELARLGKGVEAELRRALAVTAEARELPERLATGPAPEALRRYANGARQRLAKRP